MMLYWLHVICSVIIVTDYLHAAAAETSVELLQGDVLAKLQAEVEVVLHCAASTDFDQRIDAAFLTNCQVMTCDQ